MSSGHRGKGAGWYTRQEVLSRFVGTAKELKDKRLMIYCFRHTQGYTAAKMPSPPPAPLPSMSTGHRFIPSAREAGELKLPSNYFSLAVGSEPNNSR